MEPGSTVLSQAVMGGTDIGEDFAGYGEARYFSVDNVAQTAGELSRADLEAEITARYDPARMNDLGIYPGGWGKLNADDQFAWLLEEFRRLRDFYVDASKRGNAIVTCIV
jgi:hypothetical protein